MNGRTSLLVLLDAAGIPTEELWFIEHIRKLRNAYAHDIRNVDLSLIDLISKRKDKSQLIKHLSSIRKYDEADLIQGFGKDPRFFRFLIIGATLRVLFYAYHLAVKTSRNTQASNWISVSPEILVRISKSGRPREGWTKREFDRMRVAAKEADAPMDSIDRLIVLDRGIISPPRTAGRWESGEADSIFLDAYVHIVNFLGRESRRREPVDWQISVTRKQIGWKSLE